MHLRGRVILDCSILLPGPFVGKLLAYQGARVIKVESPSKPDPAKTMLPLYEDLNGLKEIIHLDLLDPKDQPKFHELVRNADGLIEAFRPAAKSKLGLNAAHLHAINPKLCILSLVGYPESSPLRERAGHDLNFAAVTGFLSLMKEMPPLPLADLFGSYEGAYLITAAIDSVSRGSKGTRTVVSLTDVLKRVQSLLIADYKFNQVLPGPGKTLFTGKYPCYRVYTCADGRRISVGAMEHKFWKRLCSVLKLPHLVDSAYDTGKKGREVVQELQKAFQSRTWPEWSKRFENVDCCVDPVLDYQEVYGNGV